MAVLGLNLVFDRIKQDQLIDNLGQRDLTNPEGVGFDLRISELNKVTDGGAFLEADGPSGLGKRKGVQTELVASYNPDSETQEEVTIEPGEYYLGKTAESVNMPQDLMAQLFARTTMFRSGLVFLGTKVDPGYKGPLAFGLVNVSKFPVKLQMGARVCNLVFYEIEGETVAYRGQHQGGRITPAQEEQQV